MQVKAQSISSLSAVAVELNMSPSDVADMLVGTIRIMMPDFGNDPCAVAKALSSNAGSDLVVTYVREYLKRQEILFNAYQTNPAFRAKVQEEIADILHKAF